MSDDIVCNFDITPDGQWLISGLYSYYADLWDLQTGAIIHRFGPHISDPQREIIDVVISPDKKWIMTNMRGGTGPFLWNAETIEKVHDFLSGAHVYFSKDGKSLINYDMIYSLPSLELTGKLTDFYLTSPLIVFSKTSDLFITFEGYYGYLRITVRDWDTKKILKAFSNPEMDQMSAGGIDVTPDDKIIVTGIATGEILFWDVEKETVIKRLKVMNWEGFWGGPDYYLPNPKFSPDGKYLITNCGGDINLTARLYRVSDILQTSSVQNFSVQK